MEVGIWVLPMTTAEMNDVGIFSELDFEQYMQQ